MVEATPQPVAPTPPVRPPQPVAKLPTPRIPVGPPQRVEKPTVATPRFPPVQPSLRRSKATPPAALPPAPPSLAPIAAPIRRVTQTTAPVRAIAVAHEKSNAVGTIELSCTAVGLLIQFVRVSAYSDGYVPYPTTSTERVTVPYEQVASVEVDSDGLVHLTVDPSCTPYSRMVLAGLVRDPAFDAASSHRRRARVERNVTLAALVAWIPVALTLRAVMPDVSALMVMGVAASASGLLHMAQTRCRSQAGALQPQV